MPLRPRRSASPSQCLVAEDLWLDGRLALYHEDENWLAVADLHFGFELSQRAAGRMVPWWGMESTTEGLIQLLEDYRPARLIILGDLVHDHAAAEPARALIESVRSRCELIMIAGNHDRQLRKSFDFVDSWESRTFHFHHGHCAKEEADRVQIIGHHHPAGTVRDGAGLRFKLPALVRRSRCWIMPAFSPWASGVEWQSDSLDRVWLCTPQRILEPETEAV